MAFAVMVSPSIWSTTRFLARWLPRTSPAVCTWMARPPSRNGSSKAATCWPTSPIEFVYKRDSMDTDGYEKKWYANDLGVNYFFNKHKAKVQFLYRMESNVNGADGDDRNQFIMQWQFVF